MSGNVISTGNALVSKTGVQVLCSLVEDTNINQIVIQPNVRLVFSATIDKCVAPQKTIIRRLELAREAEEGFPEDSKINLSSK